MIFQFMEKYRTPILIAVLLGMAGFGVWVFVVQWFRGPSKGEIKAKEVVASFVVGGEKHEITRRDLYMSGSLAGSTADLEKRQANLLSRLIREKLVDAAGVNISDEELQEILDKEVREPIAQANDGKFDPQAYIQFCNRIYRRTPSAFEAALREDARLAKLMREVDRAIGLHSSEEILQQFQKQFQKIKLKGVIFDPATFEAKSKLEKNENGDYSADALAKLAEYWKGLSDDEKKRFHKGGALLTAEYVGFLFGKDKYKDDAVLDDDFKKVNPISKTSLEELTKEFEPDDAVLAKLKGRVDRHRQEYGIDKDADIDEVFEKRKQRFVEEWKILKLLKKIHEDLAKKSAAGETIDLADVAKKNNLSYFKFSNMTLQDLTNHADVPGTYPFQLQGLKPGTLLTMRNVVTPETDPFDQGVVDVVAKHGSIWRLVEKDLSPIPNLNAVRDDVAKDFETKEAEKLRTAAIEGFQKAMDQVLDAKVKDFAATVKADIEKEIQEEIQGLDPEKDKDRIEEIKSQKDEEAKARIDEEKEKYRGEAFDAALSEASDALIVEEGFFLPYEAVREPVLDKDKVTSEDMARSFLRREFRVLHDQAAADKFVEPGTVSEPVKSVAYRGFEGIAKLEAKKVPTDEDMFLRPMLLAQAEFALQRKSAAAEDKPSMWDYEHLKSGDFHLVAVELDKEIEQRREDERKAEESRKRLEAERKRRLEERQKAIRKENGAEEAPKDEPRPVKK